MKEAASDIILDWIRHFEGCPADEHGCYMYLDSVGVVTAGYGFAMPNDLTAQRFRWTAISGATATPADVHIAFCSIFKRGPNNLLPSTFASKTMIRMSLSDAASYLVDELDTFEGVVKGKITNFDVLPAAAQVAVMDMAWNLGPSFTSGYPKFTQSILACDFTSASVQCASRGTPEERSSSRRALFEYSA